MTGFDPFRRASMKAKCNNSHMVQLTIKVINIVYFIFANKSS